MKSNQRKYLDKVVDLIVRDTIIDYDNETLTYPFLVFSRHSSRSFSSLYRLLSSFYISPYLSFSEYCRDTYGLNEEETEYVWKEYKDIIIDKIRNER